MVTMMSALGGLNGTWPPPGGDMLNVSEPPQQLCPSDEVFHMSWIGHGILIPMIAAIGMILNVLNLLVLCSGRLTESSYTYLTCLAFADFCSLAVFFVNGIGRGNFPEQYEWRMFEAYVYFPCGTITTTADALLTVTVSVERCTFLYEPMKAKRWCNQRTARRVAAFVWMVAILINIPRFFVFKVDKTCGRLVYTEFGQSASHNYLSWFYFVAISVSCGVALIVSNIMLMRGIQRTHRRKRSLGASSAHSRQDDTRLTRTLVSVVTVYLVGEIPSALLSRSVVVPLIGRGDATILETLGFKVASLVATILIVAQLSLNFVVYCVFNQRFWAAFKLHLCRCLVGHVPETNGHCLLTREPEVPTVNSSTGPSHGELQTNHKVLR